MNDNTLCTNINIILAACPPRKIEQDKCRQPSKLSEIMVGMAIGFTDYSYGTYSIRNNKITLNPPTKGGHHDIRYMLILDPKDGSDIFAMQTNSLGNILDEYIKYRIVVDNRDKMKSNSLGSYRE